MTVRMTVLTHLVSTVAAGLLAGDFRAIDRTLESPNALHLEEPPAGALPPRRFLLVQASAFSRAADRAGFTLGRLAALHSRSSNARTTSDISRPSHFILNVRCSSTGTETGNFFIFGILCMATILKAARRLAVKILEALQWRGYEKRLVIFCVPHNAGRWEQLGRFGWTPPLP
jgi:hypothetical protein